MFRDSCLELPHREFGVGEDDILAGHTTPNTAIEVSDEGFATVGLHGYSKQFLLLGYEKDSRRSFFCTDHSIPCIFRRYKGLEVVFPEPYCRVPRSFCDQHRVWSRLRWWKPLHSRSVCSFFQPGVDIETSSNLQLLNWGVRIFVEKKNKLVRMSERLCH